MGDMAMLLLALGEHAWSCIYDKEQKKWCLWHNGKCIMTSSKKNVEDAMRATLNCRRSSL